MKKARNSGRCLSKCWVAAAVAPVPASAVGNL